MKTKLLLVFTICLSLQMIAQNSDWKVLGKKDVTYKHEDDVVNLRGSEKEIKKFKIRCTQGTLKLKKVVVVYKDNSRDEKKPKGTGIINKNMSSFAFSIDKNKTPDKIELSTKLLEIWYSQNEQKLNF